MWRDVENHVSTCTASPKRKAPFIWFVPFFSLLRWFFGSSCFEVKKIHASSPWLDSSEELDSGQSSGSEANDVQRSLITQDHENGTCQPCVFFASTWGCKLASRCDFCHLQHSNKNLAGNIRPQRRERAKTKEKILDLLKSFQQQLQEEVRENHYVRKEVIHFLNPQLISQVCLFDCFFHQKVYCWGSILERKELAGRAPELCGWALCPGLVLAAPLNSVNSVAGSVSRPYRPCPPLVLVLAAPLNSVNSVAGLCVQALSSSCPPLELCQLCGWALWLNSVSRPCPPLVLLLAAP